MSADPNQTNSKLISQSIRNLLENGAAAVLVTLLDSPETDSQRLAIGAKLLVKDSANYVGSLGDSDLDNAVTEKAASFLKARVDASSLRVGEFAPELEKFH
ncbi:MAG: XdhC family protein, partial [Acidobacteriota bacterium]